MPIYEFRCAGCDRVEDLLLALGETRERTCSDCGSAMRHRFARVGVRYSAWGFNSTDRLSREPGRHDFLALRDTAERVAEE